MRVLTDAEGEPKLAFACIDGTVARAHQKVGRSETEQTDGLSLRLNRKTGGNAQALGCSRAGSAARSLAFAMPSAGSSSSCWCRATRTNLHFARHRRLNFPTKPLESGMKQALTPLLGARSDGVFSRFSSIGAILVHKAADYAQSKPFSKLPGSARGCGTRRDGGAALIR